MSRRSSDFKTHRPYRVVAQSLLGAADARNEMGGYTSGRQAAAVGRRATAGRWRGTTS